MTEKMTIEKARENYARGVMTFNNGECVGFIEAWDSREAELNSLKNQIEIAEKALVYCAIQPELLQPENNRQCACAYNALNELKVLKEMEK